MIPVVYVIDWSLGFEAVFDAEHRSLGIILKSHKKSNFANLEAHYYVSYEMFLARRTDKRALDMNAVYSL